MSIPILGVWIAVSLVVTVLILVYLARRGSSRALPDTTRGGYGPYANAPAPQAARAPSATTLALLGLIVSILSLISSTVIGLLEVFRK